MFTDKSRCVPNFNLHDIHLETSSQYLVLHDKEDTSKQVVVL